VTYPVHQLYASYAIMTLVNFIITVYQIHVYTNLYTCKIVLNAPKTLKKQIIMFLFLSQRLFIELPKIARGGFNKFYCRNNIHDFLDRLTAVKINNVGIESYTK